MLIFNFIYYFSSKYFYLQLISSLLINTFTDKIRKYTEKYQGEQSNVNVSTNFMQI